MILRRAYRRCHHSALDHLSGYITAGVSLAIGAYGLTFGASHSDPAVAAGFLLFGLIVAVAFDRTVGQCRRRNA